MLCRPLHDFGSSFYDGSHAGSARSGSSHNDAIPAVDSRQLSLAHLADRRIVEMVTEALSPETVQLRARGLVTLRSETLGLPSSLATGHTRLYLCEATSNKQFRSRDVAAVVGCGLTPRPWRSRVYRTCRAGHCSRSYSFVVCCSEDASRSLAQEYRSSQGLSPLRECAVIS